MQKGREYQFEGYYQLASNCEFISGQIGIAFIDKPSSDPLNSQPILIEQSVSVDHQDPFQGDPLSWNLIKGTFIAQGNESYLIVGNFFPQKRVQLRKIRINSSTNPNLQGKSYAYLDNLKLWESGTPAPRDEISNSPDCLTELNMVLSDINFGYNDYRIKSSAMSEIDKFFRILKDRFYNMELTITGHTDSIGGDEFNIRLSRKRAYEVAKYLIRKGFPSTQITTEGKGFETPLFSNKTEQNRSLNRRVEIKVHEIKAVIPN